MTTEVRDGELWRREEKEEEGGILQALDPCVSAVAVSLEVALTVVAMSVVVVLVSEDYFVVSAISMQNNAEFSKYRIGIVSIVNRCTAKKGYECEGTREHRVDRGVHRHVG